MATKFRHSSSELVAKITSASAAVGLALIFSCAAGAAPGSNSTSGSSSGNPGPEPGDSVVSSPISHSAGGDHEWTQEEMLLARPMPMTKEGRDFSFIQKAPDTIRSWTLGEFHQYTRTLAGRNELKVEGQRWLGIRQMLKQQIALGKAFFANPKNFQPGRKKSKRHGSGVTGGGGNSTTATGSTGPEFDEESFEAGESANTFDRLKACRQDIHDLCNTLDGMKKLALRRGRLDEFESALTAE